MYVYFIFWGASLAWACIIRSKLAQLAFACATFAFLGLRFETGFDWVFYKNGFEVLQNDFSFDAAILYSELFQIDFGFVLLAALIGQIFPQYEYFQALVAIVFLVSIFSLCRAFSVKNVALVIAIAATFLLLTLMMSTLRQCLAVSLFNFALCAAVSRHRVAMIILLVAAMSIHTSTLLYIAALVFAFVQPARLPSLANVVLIAAIVSVAQISMMTFVNLLPEFFVNRIDLYNLDQIFEGFSIWYLYFFGLSAFILSYTMFGNQIADAPVRSTLLRRIIVALAVMCICTLSLNVVRDRVSYEMFLLFALYLAHHQAWLAIPTRVAAVVLGLFFSIFNILTPGNRTVFAPYQNIIGVAVTGDEGDGMFRQEQFRQYFKQTHEL